MQWLLTGAALLDSVLVYFVELVFTEAIDDIVEWSSIEHPGVCYTLFRLSNYVTLPHEG